jgi:catechol 2,3-dioxygenase-like lactoylglutathione lyase family enzyme
MKLSGILHVTIVSARITGNVEFYIQVLGLRLVKNFSTRTMPQPATSLILVS